MLPAACVIAIAAVLLIIGISHSMRSYRLSGHMWLGYLLSFLAVSTAFSFFTSAAGGLAQHQGGDRSSFDNSGLIAIGLAFVIIIVRALLTYKLRLTASTGFIATMCICSAIGATLVHAIATDYQWYLIDKSLLLPVMWIYNCFLLASIFFLPSFKTERRTPPNLLVEILSLLDDGKTAIIGTANSSGLMAKDLLKSINKVVTLEVVAVYDNACLAKVIEGKASVGLHLSTVQNDTRTGGKVQVDASQATAAREAE